MSDLAAEEIRSASQPLDDGHYLTELSVPSIHCGGCIRTIERGLSQLDGILDARVNLTAKRVTIRWRNQGNPPPFIETLERLGHKAHLPEAEQQRRDPLLSELLRSLAVAGFATGNIMLLSVSVWAGAEAEARNLFHWISAAIALPVLAYSGRVFFRSAWAALRRGRTNMDVPISIGVLLAFAMSLYDTIHHSAHAYFDASVMLLFFLLIGRTLDHLMRERARSAVSGLARLAPRTALVEQPDGNLQACAVETIADGDIVAVEAGERVPVDARVLTGSSDLDCSLVTGESLPRNVTAGAELHAGVLNLTGPLRLRATASASSSFLAQMVRLMQAAESGRSAYRRIADRASRLYAPLVHTLALLSFIGWMAIAGDLHLAVTIAVAVLIITCPCALGLAVPMVQVVAARRLFERGVLAKDGGALERLAEVDTVVFDKTGTLTLGRAVLQDISPAAQARLALAASLARHSHHPYSRALADAQPGPAKGQDFESIREIPGCGVEAVAGGSVYRLGRSDWALDSPPPEEQGDTESCSLLSENGRLLARYSFRDSLRPGTQDAVTALRARGLQVEMLSGDQPGAVEALARQLGIERFSARVRPEEKAERLAALAAQGRKVLMVGDGLNDAPALASAHVSMAPATAADVGRNAADLVFVQESLEAVPQALRVARHAARLVRQNFALAILYNAVALPFAVAGYVTPLFAALAMSGSSIAVIGNALRLNFCSRKTPAPREQDREASSPAGAVAGVAP